MVLQGGSIGYRLRSGAGVTDVSIVNPEEWAELWFGQAICYGIAHSLTLEELQLQGVEVNF